MLAAQHAAIGARICTTSAIRTMGRNFRSRRRMNRSTRFDNAYYSHWGSRCRGPALPVYGLHTHALPVGNYSAIWKELLHFPVLFCARPPLKSPYWRFVRNRWWRNSNHFAKCSNFEQSLPEMVTRPSRWSTSAGSGWPRGLSLVVQVSGGALARTSSVAPSIKIKSKFAGK
jgi:hypothetical protein